MKIRPGVELASLTDVGCVRDSNEDRLGYWEPDSDELFRQLGRLAIVADGMGGYSGGQIASQMAVEIISDVYARSSDSDAQRALSRAFSEAHRQIRERADLHPGLSEMGTTCTALALVNGQAYFAHVGDSRLYSLSGGRLQLLTRDHTLVARWVQNGIIRAEDAERHPQRHVLTTALGVPEGTQPDFSPQPIPTHSGDVLMLCTDGLWGQVREEEIRRILALNPPEKSCRLLCDLAKYHGGPDNITLQVLRIS